ncbi:zinc-ribbon domain-containing protein [Bacteroides thetaiotaomicron]|uniref:zinc-ribbon domain-containing protein n=1 Tax=Bacteroides thetaiotaomicron TaxID=818 RepID=UPI0035641A2C
MMAFCINCGKQVPADVKFCTSCGSPVTGETEQTVRQQPVQSPPPVVQPQTEYAHQQGYTSQTMQQPMQQQSVAIYTEEPITTGGYIGIFLLLMLPLVNMICLIIWACGGCRKVNKRNMARAMLIWMIIGAVLSGVVVLIITLFFSSELDSLKELATDLGE